eukprot:scaffold11342_cov114-Isochrysis_galbana.AAC.8
MRTASPQKNKRQETSRRASPSHACRRPCAQPHYMKRVVVAAKPRSKLKLSPRSPCTIETLTRGMRWRRTPLHIPPFTARRPPASCVRI